MASRLVRSYQEKTNNTNWYNSVYFSALHTDPFVQAKVDFLVQLLRSIDIQTDDYVLDLHAEEGKIAYGLLREGYQVHGLDYATARVQQAAMYAEEGLTIRLNHSLEQCASQYYKFVYTLNAHFSQLHSETEQIEYLQQIAQCMRPDGYLLIDYFNIQTLLAQLPMQRFQHLGDVHIQSRTYQKGQFIRQEVRVRDGAYKGHYSARAYIHFKESFEYILLRAGLRIARTYGDHNLQPFYRETAPRLILLVEKR